MTDTERLEWIADHVLVIAVGTETGHVKITWFDDDGEDYVASGAGNSYADGLRKAVDAAASGEGEG